MRYKYYRDKVYGVNYHFVFDIKDTKKLPLFIKKNNTKMYKWYTSKDTPNEDKAFSGRTIQSGNVILILIKNDKDTAFKTATLVHELLHSMFFVFGERGVEIQDGGNNEHCTYYLDHLVYEALKR